MTPVRYRLRFRAPLHSGTRDGWLEGTEGFVRSDTLFSGLCHAWTLLWGKAALEDLLERFRSGAPPFRLTSCFPFVGARDFYPVPRSARSESKKLKKASWVDRETFERFLFDPGRWPAGAQGAKPAAEVDRVPRLAPPRLGGGAGENFFHFGRLLFEENAGLHFHAAFEDASLRPRFQAALRLLGDEGIGGDRSAGHGVFDIESSPLELPAGPPESGFAVLLGLLIPREEAGCLGDAWYELVERRGYVYSPFTHGLRRRSVRALAEGSVVPRSLAEGILADVTPEAGAPHRVYRFGMGLAVPCAAPSGGEEGA